MCQSMGDGTYVAYLVVVILGSFCAVVFSLEYSLSPFMLWDDNWYLAKALTGQPIPYPTQPIHHLVIGGLSLQVKSVFMEEKKIIG